MTSLKVFAQKGRKGKVATRKWDMANTFRV
jgi:hypothetical protein